MNQANENGRGLGQSRAHHAWQAAERLAAVKQAERDDYAREARKLPIRIRSAGLGQALAFLEAKASGSKTGVGGLLEDLNSWVLGERLGRGDTNESLLFSVIDRNAIHLRRATDESMSYLEWLNRFIEARGWPAKVEE
jgi:CRISPR-associated protein Cmr5